MRQEDVDVHMTPSVVLWFRHTRVAVLVFDEAIEMQVGCTKSSMCIETHVAGVKSSVLFE